MLTEHFSLSPLSAKLLAGLALPTELAGSEGKDKKCCKSYKKGKRCKKCPRC
jgi:hypothetical protein